MKKKVGEVHTSIFNKAHSMLLYIKLVLHQMAHSCSESFYDHAASRCRPKQKLAFHAQTFALAVVALQGHGTRKKLQFALHEPFYAFISQVIYSSLYSLPRA